MEKLFSILIGAFLLSTLFLLAGCMGNQQPTLDELKLQKFKISVNGIAFDVPVLYLHHDYYPRLKKWPQPTLLNRLGLRQAVDVMAVEALLPNMEPYTAENAETFDELGHGKKIKISITNRPWDSSHYFKDIVPRYLISNNSGIPIDGFTRYEDPFSKHIVYLNRKSPDEGLIYAYCYLNDDSESPVCLVQAYYKKTLGLQYYFSRKYIGDLPEVHRQVLQLIDQLRVKNK